ncbi:MAG: hypothetical protein AAF411_18410 [Myxococcota bacterium]
MSFLDLRDAYVTRFAAISGVRRAIAADPSWDEDELRRVGAQGTPLVLVMCDGIGRTDLAEFGDTHIARFDFTAVVIAQKGDAVRLSKASPGDIAASIASRIVSSIERGDRPNGECGRRPTVRAENVTDAGLARHGRFAWALQWSADALVDLDAQITLRPLDAIHVNYDIDGDNDEGADPDYESTVDGLQEAS